MKYFTIVLFLFVATSFVSPTPVEAQHLNKVLSDPTKSIDTPGIWTPGKPTSGIKLNATIRDRYESDQRTTSTNRLEFSSAAIGILAVPMQDRRRHFALVATGFVENTSGGVDLHIGPSLIDLKRPAVLPVNGLKVQFSKFVDGRKKLVKSVRAKKKKNKFLATVPLGFLKLNEERLIEVHLDE